MKPQEEKAMSILKNRSLKELCELWKLTENRTDSDVYTVRGWLLKELEAREPEKFNRWIDTTFELENPEIDDLEKFMFSDGIIKEGSRILVRIKDTTGNIIKTSNYNNIFEVIKKGGNLGIAWTGKNDFSPFSNFSRTVYFEEVFTGKSYFYSVLTHQLEATN